MAWQQPAPTRNVAENYAENSTDKEYRQVTKNSVLQVKLESGATPPQRAHDGDAGFDLAALSAFTLASGANIVVRTGVSVKLPANTVGLVHSRSGLAAKRRIVVLNAPGVIDENYTGEILVNLMNHGRSPYTFQAGERIAQLIIQEYQAPVIEYVNQLPDTERGSNGHGSTGR